MSTREIAEKTEATGLIENKVPAKKWWKIAKDARKKLEKQTGKDIITGNNFLSDKRDNLKTK
jgi:hypothetical protein